MEYFEQSVVEGEIQRWSAGEAKNKIHGDLHEIIKGQKLGRENEKEITLYDSVGIALEDYSVLTLTYELLQKYGLGEDFTLVPELKNPKNLMGFMND